VLAGWSASHGFATLWRSINLQDRFGADAETYAALLTRGVISLGTVNRRPAGLAAAR
jgi:hypothetical protein